MTVTSQIDTVFDNTVMGGRLTLQSNVPVPGDVTAAGTIYYTPYKGNRISIYRDNEDYWKILPFSQLSIAAPTAANKVSDIFIFENPAGSGTLELFSIDWTNDTTRAVSLVIQDGVYVPNGSANYRYLGTVRTILASQIWDSFLYRHCWNYYNRVSSFMQVTPGTPSWNYDTNTYRYADGNANNQLDYVVGVQEDVMSAFVSASAINSGGSSVVQVGIGLNGVANIAFTSPALVAAGDVLLNSNISLIPNVGRNYMPWIEKSSTTLGSTLFNGTDCGITGTFTR